MNIGFLSNQIGLRGTEVAMFDYAKYNEELLGNKSTIVTFGNELNPSAMSKFTSRFKKVNVILNSVYELNKFVDSNKVDVLYKICFGNPEYIPTNCKTVIHAVFNTFNPFGDVYSYVSEYIRDKSVPLSLRNRYDFVPHMISLSDTNENLREELNIPNEAIIFGYHGGRDSFNLDFVKKTIVEICSNRKDIYFLFMNIDKFYEDKQIRYLDGTSDMGRKTKFINSCNAMLHARSIGETFGVSCGEFSVRNKPVIAFKYVNDCHHIDVLKNSIVLYDGEESLRRILTRYHDWFDKNKDYRQYSKFSPEKVMEKFQKVYLT